MFEILLYFSAIASNLPVILYNIYVSYRDKTGHMRSFTEAIRPLVPLFVFFAICTVWVIKSPNSILEKEPRVIYFLTGTIFSNISVSYLNFLYKSHVREIIFQCRLIVAQMSNTRCEIFNWLLVPSAITVFLSLVTKNPELEIGLTYALCVLSTLAHIHYGTCLVSHLFFIALMCCLIFLS